MKKEVLKLSVMDAVATFYVAEALKAHSDDKQVPIGMTRFINCHVQKLAVALRDYMVVAALGEARHAVEKGEYWCPQINGKKVHRESAYENAHMFSVDSALKGLETVFENHWSGTGYGGRKWGEIVRYAGKYGTLSDKIFIDIVINKEHNGGNMFNKSVIFGPASSHFISFLNYRRDRDILTDAKMPFKVYESLRPYLMNAVQYGLIPAMPEHIEFIATPEYPEPIKWGFIRLVVEENRHHGRPRSNTYHCELCDDDYEEEDFCFQCDHCTNCCICEKYFCSRCNCYHEEDNFCTHEDICFVCMTKNNTCKSCTEENVCSINPGNEEKPKCSECGEYVNADFYCVQADSCLTCTTCKHSNRRACPDFDNCDYEMKGANDNE
jgi:hypothetical protein